VKRSTAVRHLDEMVEDCVEDQARRQQFGEDYGVVVTALWAYGDILDATKEWTDQDSVARAAAALDLPEDEVPWLGIPPSVRWINDRMRWTNRPVHVVWRSARAPVWNHFIERPLLLWDKNAGARHLALAALRDRGDIEVHREAAPAAEELKSRLQRELEISLAAVRATTATYDDKRWARGSPIKYADALFESKLGYLDIIDARKE